MNILPKYYNIIFEADDGRITTGFQIARNPDNAYKAAKKMTRKMSFKIVSISLFEQSYIGNLLAMLLPFYNVAAKGKWIRRRI